MLSDRLNIIVNLRREDLTHPLQHVFEIADAYMEASMQQTACQSTDQAPDCYNEGCALPEGGTGGGGSSIHCDDIVNGALAATYSYTPGFSGEWNQWEVEGLPQGLSIDEVTGVIQGTPQGTGEFALTLSALGEFETERDENTCTLIINDALSFDVSGLPKHCVSPEDLDKLMDDANRGSNAVLSVDLESQEITGPDGGTIKFDIDAFKRHCLLNGLDDIGLTLEKAASIAAFEKTNAQTHPWA